jgi:hypothetical protein
MSLAGGARMAAYLAACLIVGASVLAASEAGRVRGTAWPRALERVDASLARGDAREVRRHWEEAYRDAIRGRAVNGLLAVGHTALRIGEAAQDRQSAVPEARRIFLTAFFEARERHDPDGVALVGTAFVGLGDREVADRVFDVALALATRNRDSGARERVSALAGRATSSHVTSVHSP